MRKLVLSLFMLLLIAGGGGASYAQSRSSSSRPSSPSSSRPSSSSPSSSRPSSSAVHSGSMMVVNTPRQKSVSRVPKSSVSFNIGVNNYYRHNSKFYVGRGGKYHRTPPPFGFRVALLPALYTTFVFNSMTYYASDGVIYRSLPDSEYEVVAPEVGMIVPELPEVNVSEVVIDGATYFKFDNYLYKQIPTTSGVQYEVIGTLID